MIRIRLRRVGAKRQPSYRIVVADSRSPRDGRFIERIGFYNPRTEPATMNIDEERALHWLSCGAKPSEAVEHILNKIGTLGRYQRMHSGEDMAALVAEAQAEAESRGQADLRTRRDDVAPAKVSRKSRARAAQPEAAPEAEAEAEAEVAE